MSPNISDIIQYLIPGDLWIHASDGAALLHTRYGAGRATRVSFAPPTPGADALSLSCSVGPGGGTIRRERLRIRDGRIAVDEASKGFLSDFFRDSHDPPVVLETVDWHRGQFHGTETGLRLEIVTSASEGAQVRADLWISHTERGTLERAAHSLAASLDETWSEVVSWESLAHRPIREMTVANTLEGWGFPSVQRLLGDDDD